MCMLRSRPCAGEAQTMTTMPNTAPADSRRRARQPRKGDVMSVYSVVEIIGTSSTSWEEAAAEAVRTAGQHLRELRVAEVVEQDIHLDEGGAITYRTQLQISFKYAPGH